MSTSQPSPSPHRWYRYHQLFADVLQALSLDEQPDLVSVVHGRASEWYQQHGQASDAIRHAFAARDFERAIGVVATLVSCTVIIGVAVT